MKFYIHEKENSTNFTWNHQKVMLKLGEARNHHGRVLDGFDGKSTSFEVEKD